MNEINMVPFIDVMLVLLIIFMVTAPLITTGVVDLPSVGRAQQQEKTKINLLIGKDEKLSMRIGQKDAVPVSLAQLAAQVRQAQGGDEQVPVVISADRNVKYDSVVRVMDTLQRAGVKRVGLAVKQGG
jgi:biopolymer transport protein TolR